MKKVTCHDIEGNTIEVGEELLRFRPSIYGLLIEDGKILLSKQYDGYEFPGGGIELTETLEEALKREYFEETGLHVEMGDVVHIQSSFFHPSHSQKYKSEFWNCPLLYCLVTRVGGELSKENFDEEEKEYADLAEWVDLAKIDELKFINSVDSPLIIRKAI